MAVEITKLVWNADIARHDKFLLLAIAEFSDGDGKCWPGIPRLATMLDCSERNVQLGLRRLESAGLLETQISAGRFRTNDYRVNIEAVLALEKVKPTSQTGATGAPVGVKPTSPSAAPKGEAHFADGEAHFTQTAKPTSPKPSIEPSEESLGSRKVKRATELPERWVLPDGCKEWAKGKGFDIRTIFEQAERFKAHHLSKGSKFKNWDQAYRTWMLKHREFARERSGGPSQGSRVVQYPKTREGAPAAPAATSPAKSEEGTPFRWPTDEEKARAAELMRRHLWQSKKQERDRIKAERDRQLEILEGLRA